MKRVCKNAAPQSLINYISSSPGATWEQMRKKSPETYRECRRNAVRDQNGLCAYCEQKISIKGLQPCSIEHFRPKSDKSVTNNQALDWKNMLAVCDGGSRSTVKERVTFPLPANLTCDQSKNRMVQKGKLPAACEGYLLNPLEVPPLINLFDIDKATGYFKPNTVTCAEVELSGNAHKTTEELVENTIYILNLNCDRLAEKRKIKVVNDIAKKKEILRKKEMSPEEASSKLVTHYFGTKWPEFFTAVRCCLGKPAEDYLKSVNFQG